LQVTIEKVVLLRFASRYRRLLRVLWICAVFTVVVGSLLPASSSALKALDALRLNDKVLHFSAYAALAFLPALHESRRALVTAAMLLVVLGIAIEYGQLVSFGRSFEYGDMGADAAGVVFGMATALAIRASVP